MNVVGEFEKVPFVEFRDAVEKMHITKDGISEHYDLKELLSIWYAIKIPTRATSGSAGHDFAMPFDLNIGPNPTVFPTGIRCKIEPGWMLVCCPRSGLGFKHGTRLRNTLGIIDSDYYAADNFGHICVSMSADDCIDLKQGDKFMQGIFIPYGVTAESAGVGADRTGGFGSTDD